MVGTERSRGYCLELVRAAFLAGEGRRVFARGDPDGDPPPCASAAAGVSARLPQLTRVGGPRRFGGGLTQKPCENSNLPGMLWVGDKVPSLCICMKCRVPLEFGDHSHDMVELLACPEHRRVDEASTAPRQAEPGAERGVLRDKDGNRIVGFCLWCDKDFYSMEEVEAHNADGMKACPVHEELKDEHCMPPVLQIMLEQAGLLKEDEQGESDDPDPMK